MLDATDVPVIALDGHGLIVDVSLAAAQVLGDGALQGRALTACVADDDRAAVTRALERCRTGGTTSVTVRVGPGSAPMIASLHAAGRDVVAILRRPEPQASSHGVIVVDVSGTVTFADDRAKALVGDGLPHALRRLVDGLLESPGTAGPEVADVGTHSIRATGARAGGDRLVVLVVEDVTAEVQHDRVMHEFLRNAAHQIRTPLAGILAAAEMLQSEAKEGAADRDLFLGHLVTHANRLAQIGRGLMTLARYRAGQPPPLDSVLLGPLLDAVAAAAGAEIAVECPPQLTAVASPELLRETVTALVENALAHGGGAGVRVAARRAGDVVQVTVADRGPGISPEALPRVFEPFFHAAADERGIGLGLAVTAQAVEAMNGTIDVSSPAGGETTFTVTLQAATTTS
jgi:signal transduction histidine kinase